MAFKLLMSIYGDGGIFSMLLSFPSSITVCSELLCILPNSNRISLKAIDHFMYVSGFSCTTVASTSVIIVVLSGYRYVLLFVHSGLLL